ncbi:MAG: hypothetical protein JRH16_07280 [Deltaproteobacteria bacterium]|nr:hypothetical protein [Deltaproteobacteria bacterium]MBW2360005.1 hypothetical protein [Deltaproteobacteria bacterium]
MSDVQQWRRCSVCKEPIAYASGYWVCNVSTCNRKRTGLAFCSVRCWEVHLPGANHREAWAVEREAPASHEAAEQRPRRRAPTLGSDDSAAPGSEILIVASRLKEYVRRNGEFSTSDKALGPLSDLVRDAVDTAIENARRDGRRTLLDRDIPGTS